MLISEAGQRLQHYPPSRLIIRPQESHPVEVDQMRRCVAPPDFGLPGDLGKKSGRDDVDGGPIHRGNAVLHFDPDQFVVAGDDGVPPV